jgi:hypothetical protein
MLEAAPILWTGVQDSTERYFDSLALLRLAVVDTSGQTGGSRVFLLVLGSSFLSS